MATSRFTRLNAQGIKSLKPVTIILHGDKPIAVSIQYEEYLRMQEDLEQRLNLAKRLIVVNFVG